MRGNISALMAAATILAIPAHAQERTRSPQYSGEAVDNCYRWSVGFEHVSCSRRPLPGSGLMAQVYTLTDGSFRTLTQDPGVQSAKSPEKTTPEMPMLEAVQPEPAPDATVAPLAEAEENSVSATEDPLPESYGLSKDVVPPTKNPNAELQLPSVITVQPGRTEILPVARGHLNRLETPFSNPLARAAARDGSSLDLQFDQNFIYASVTEAVTLFVHQSGYPDPAIVIGLIPMQIAPRQVKLMLPGVQLAEAKKNNKVAAEKPKVAAKPTNPQKANSRGVTRNRPANKLGRNLAEYIQTFAKGRVPKGFTPISVQGYDPTSFCKRTNGVTYSFAQGAAVVSNHYIIVRGMVSANRTVELNELDCAINPRTLAVAFSPRTQVAPRQPTDFFVLMRQLNTVMLPTGKK